MMAGCKYDRSPLAMLGGGEEASKARMLCAHYPNPSNDPATSAKDIGDI